MDLKAVIFDFDGTLADTRKLIVAAKQEMMKQLGLKVLDEATCIATIGLTAYDAFSKDYPELSQEEIEVVVKTYRAKFDELKTTMPPELFPGVDTVFAELKKRGIARTIATSRNKKSLYEFVGNWGMTDDFAVILCAEDTEKVKPNPDPVLKTLEALSISGNQALVVGDMPVDILMGKRAGAFACGVTYGNSNREELLAAGADFVIDSMEELLGIL